MIRYVSVDVEADGPCPSLYSMVSLGAVFVDDQTLGFYGELAPISSLWLEDALKVSGFTRRETCKFRHPSVVMKEFYAWLLDNKGDDCKRLQFVSDNAGFDWQFINYYFHAFVQDNPFGHSPFSLTSFYKGYTKNMRSNFKRDGLIKTKHTHNALDDARGNAEALATLLTRIVRSD